MSRRFYSLSFAVAIILVTISARLAAAPPTGDIDDDNAQLELNKQFITKTQVTEKETSYMWATLKIKQVIFPGAPETKKELSWFNIPAVLVESKDKKSIIDLCRQKRSLVASPDLGLLWKLYQEKQSHHCLMTVSEGAYPNVRLRGFAFLTQVVLNPYISRFRMRASLSAEQLDLMKNVKSELSPTVQTLVEYMVKRGVKIFFFGTLKALSPSKTSASNPEISSPSDYKQIEEISIQYNLQIITEVFAETDYPEQLAKSLQKTKEFYKLEGNEFVVIVSTMESSQRAKKDGFLGILDRGPEGFSFATMEPVPLMPITGQPRSSMEEPPVPAIIGVKPPPRPRPPTLPSTDPISSQMGAPEFEKAVTVEKVSPSVTAKTDTTKKGKKRVTKRQAPLPPSLEDKLPSSMTAETVEAKEVGATMAHDDGELTILGRDPKGFPLATMENLPLTAKTDQPRPIVAEETDAAAKADAPLSKEVKDTNVRPPRPLAPTKPDAAKAAAMKKAKPLVPTRPDAAKAAAMKNVRPAMALAMKTVTSSESSSSDSVLQDMGAKGVASPNIPKPSTSVAAQPEKGQTKKVTVPTTKVIKQRPPVSEKTQTGKPPPVSQEALKKTSPQATDDEDFKFDDFWGKPNPPLGKPLQGSALKTSPQATNADSTLDDVWKKPDDVKVLHNIHWHRPKKPARAVKSNPSQATNTDSKLSDAGKELNYVNDQPDLDTPEGHPLGHKKPPMAAKSQ